MAKQMKFIVIGLLLLFPFFINAQTITGFVKDAATNEPLVGVNVVIDGTTNGTATDERGFYRIKVENFPIVLSFSYIGYGTRKVSVSTLSQESINIKLVTVASNLPEAVVSAKPKIDTIYKDGYSVLDYEFFDEYILLLVYRGMRKRYSVLLIDNQGKELFDEPLGQAAP
ncbi:MAG: carboxypeptidase-like regulatory domain-containing protein, partial [Saprospiraceae bacterium]